VVLSVYNIAERSTITLLACSISILRPRGIEIYALKVSINIIDALASKHLLIAFQWMT
jgi:hypothetical protein